MFAAKLYCRSRAVQVREHRRRGAGVTVTRITRILLIAAAAACLGLLTYAADLSSTSRFFTALAFGLWVVSPFVFLLHASRRRRDNRVWQYGLLIVSMLTAAFAAVVYYDAYFVSLDAQNALVFLFVPLWQWLGAGLAVAGLAFWSRPPGERPAAS
jgi:hypothetical protein